MNEILDKIPPNGARAEYFFVFWATEFQEKMFLIFNDLDFVKLNQYKYSK